MRPQLFILISSLLVFSSNVFAQSLLGKWTAHRSLAGNTIVIEKVDNKLVATISSSTDHAKHSPSEKCVGTPKGPSHYTFCGRTYTIGDINGTTWLFSGRIFYKQNWNSEEQSLWHYLSPDNIVFFKKNSSVIAKKYQTTIQKYSKVCRVFKRLGIYLTIHQNKEYFNPKLTLAKQRLQAIENEFNINGVSGNIIKAQLSLRRPNDLQADKAWDNTYLARIGFYVKPRLLLRPRAR